MDSTSAAASPASSIVSALGGGSGVDMAALASQLASAQFASRIGRIDSQANTLETRISLAGTLKSRIQQLAAALGERVRTGDLAATPLVANGAVASASRPLGSTAAGGSYSLEVTALATRQVVASPPLASAAAPAGAGTLTLRFGTVAGGGFTEDPAHPAATIAIPAGATLETVAGAINAAATGIAAYVATGADGARLVLKGAEGAVSGFTIEVAEDPAEPGLATLAWSPAAAPERLLASAGDARFRLDGLERTAPSNTIPDAAPGVALTLTAINPGAPTTIRFSDPGAAIAAAMQDLTGALNEIASELGEAIDPRAGPLARDAGAQALRRELSRLAGSVLMPEAAEGTARSLSELGLGTNRDGTFRFDPAVLDRARTINPVAVAALFTSGLHGVYATIERIARNAAAVGDPGSLGGSVARYASLKTRLANDKEKLAGQLETLRAQMIKRFASADTRVGASRSTLSFLQNQIAAWNAKSS